MVRKIILFSVFMHLMQVLQAQNFSKYIVVDQFGYLPASNKTAVIRNPEIGYDSEEAYTPASILQVKRKNDNVVVYKGAVVATKSGAVDAISGDKVWWFDFSTLSTNGEYYVYDSLNKAQSATFVIADTVYKNILMAATKMLFYQRCGFAKDAKYAGLQWADKASHLGPLQDKNCRLFSSKTDATTERDLSGGWYDAGDYNKYTPWAANYVISLVMAYKENPSAFADNYNIPESGNGVPDILDEVKWGLDWLLKMQQANGSCLSVVGVSHASPPSSATGQSLYGPATANATMRSAAAFAIASTCLKPFFSTYSDTLKARSLKAWTWGLANPIAQFKNNSSINGSVGLAAGDQETDSLGRFTAKMSAALFMYENTADPTYLSFFEANYTNLPLIAWYNFASQYFLEANDLLFYYLRLPQANATISSKIKAALLTSYNKSGDFIGALNAQTDPYRAFIKDYNWGSNQYKSNYGNTLWSSSNASLDAAKNAEYLAAAEDYLHYIHGVNPYGFVYLTNMGSYGAENNIKEIYHTWFGNGSAKWDREGTSTYGPAPGYLSGGPNSNYSLDACCSKNTCGSTANNALCTAISSTTPPLGQPAMKAYRDFNDNWPQNSWQITEPSNGYQVAYIRLLSKFTKLSQFVAGVDDESQETTLGLHPNPFDDYLNIKIGNEEKLTVQIYNQLGKLVMENTVDNNSKLPTTQLENGMYLVKIKTSSKIYFDKIVKLAR